MDFILNLMFWIGIGFQTPLLVFALAKFNIVSAKNLAKPVALCHCDHRYYCRHDHPHD